MSNFNLTELQSGLIGYIKVVFGTLVIFAIIRFLEFGYVSFFLNIDLDPIVLFSRSINFDSLFVILVSTVLVVPVLLLHSVNHKLATIISYSVAIGLIFTNVIFTNFFLINNSLLSSVLFDFSLSTIYDIVHSEISTNRTFLWVGSFLTFTLSIFLLTKFTRRIRTSGKWNSILVLSFLIGVVIGLINHKHTFKSIYHFDSNYQFLIGNSKHVYFLKSFQPKVPDQIMDKAEIETAIHGFQNARPYFNFSHQEYPLLHDEETENVLGPFFISSESRPNIVLVVSESLSSSFSGEALGLKQSLTPFTDSLAQEGLHWSRFFSNEDRSFAAMPNILASLPSGIGARGFINMKAKANSVKNYPKHDNLIQILNKSGYQTNYFYGGWGQFDNTETYLKEMGIDFFLSDENFDSEKYTKVDNGWGYNDKDLFRQSLDILEQQSDSDPFLNIYQTISVHSPFDLSEPEYYDRSYLNSKLKELDLEAEDVQNIRDEILSSIFFADDALKLLIEKMSSLPDFENTIFIITGDHSLNLNLTDHSFENFHIPLIIWSPLLKKQATFRGACSHLDILPSLLALLEGNFSMEGSQQKHWIGQGLDTSMKNRFNRMIPLKLSSLEVPSFVHGNLVLFSGKAMLLDSSLSLTSAYNSQDIELINSLYESYRSVNSYVCSHDLISP